MDDKEPTWQGKKEPVLEEKGEDSLKMYLD